MAKKPKGKFRTHRGPKLDQELADAYEWIESRVASLKGCYGATARACREYHERFEIDKTTIGDLNAYRRSDEYRKRVAKLRKSIKNARDEWRIIEAIVTKDRVASKSRRK